MNYFCRKCKKSYHNPEERRCASPDCGGLELLFNYTGQTLDDRYTIGKLLGLGGMGTVYEATHEKMQRRVAVKFINTNQEKEVARFTREAQATSLLKSPYTVTVFDFGQTEHQDLYLVMELLEGQEVSEVLREQGHFEPMRALRVTSQACRSLSEAHQNNIIHRDLKPSNIFLARDESGEELTKVLDFGIAKVLQGAENLSSETITEIGSICGTPHFMSPEQASAKELDQRSDVYSLTCVLYTMLAGKKVFDGNSPSEVLGKHLYHPPPPVGQESSLPFSGELESMLMKGLAKSADERFQSMAEFADQIARFIDGELPIFIDLEQAEADTSTGIAPVNFPPSEDSSESDLLSSITSRSPIRPRPPDPSAISIDISEQDLSHTAADIAQQPNNAKRRVIALLSLVSLIVVGYILSLNMSHTLGTDVMVSISSEPSGATVSLNGNPLGSTPLSTEVRAQEASYELLFVWADGRSQETTCHLNAKHIETGKLECNNRESEMNQGTQPNKKKPRIIVID